MPLYEHETLAGAISLAVKGKGNSKSRGKGKQYGKQGWPSGTNQRTNLNTDYDRRVRSQASLPNGPSARNETVWYEVPNAASGAQFRTGRFLRFSASQIADPMGGASRNLLGFIAGRAASGGFARFSYSAHPVDGGAARMRKVNLRAPVLREHFEVIDLGSNPDGYDQYNIMLMLGGANYGTADHPDNFSIKVYRERNFQQIGIARHVERVTFPNWGR